MERSLPNRRSFASKRNAPNLGGVRKRRRLDSSTSHHSSSSSGTDAGTPERERESESLSDTPSTPIILRIRIPPSMRRSSPSSSSPPDDPVTELERALPHLDIVASHRGSSINRRALSSLDVEAQKKLYIRIPSKAQRDRSSTM